MLGAELFMDCQMGRASVNEWKESKTNSNCFLRQMEMELESELKSESEVQLPRD